MLGPNEDLPTLIDRKDHLGVLRYIRAHELREPSLVIAHGKSLLGPKLSGNLGDDAARLAVLEQVCLAALDQNNHDLAEGCLGQLKDKVGKESTRFRCLLARCLEASADFDGANAIYNQLLKDNPANLVALQRKYCILRAQRREPAEVIAALNEYLGQELSDVSGWYEMSKLRLSIADFKGAAYALEQVVLGCPLDSNIHMQLAEVYSTLGGLENLVLARKHMAQALELDGTNLRAKFGLVSVSYQYLEESTEASKKDIDEHDKIVAKELVRYGAGAALNDYGGSKLLAIVKGVMDDFTDNLESL